MTAREWKPGDVAQYDGTITGRILKTTGGWVDTDGDFRDPPTASLRPLVVIDPESKDDIARLAGLLSSYVGLATTNSSAVFAALREFANPTPPKPDEPTGRGAVVKDATGLSWVRVHPGGEAWVNGYQRWSHYDDIPAVCVLSEGVTS